MVQLIPENYNPTKKDIDVYVCEMVNANNHNTLNTVIREIESKKVVGAFMHPSEEYFVDCVFKHVNMKIFHVLLQSIKY